jgi:hypothetical protein
MLICRRFQKNTWLRAQPEFLKKSLYLLRLLGSRQACLILNYNSHDSHLQSYYLRVGHDSSFNFFSIHTR